MEIVTGRITAYDEKRGGMHIFAPYSNYKRLALREYSDVEVGLPDGRTISGDQRRKAYALMKEIAEWCGETPEYIKRHMKLDFIVNRLEGLKEQIFSLSDCDMTTAREYISHLIDFVFEHDVPVRVPLVSLCDDIERYVYAALTHKRCAVCGRKAELHHMDAIGMGGDRRDVYQIGMKVISLCGHCHVKAHNMGAAWITDDNHLTGISLTKEIGRVYGLTKKNLEDGA